VGGWVDRRAVLSRRGRGRELKDCVMSVPFTGKTDRQGVRASATGLLSAPVRAGAAIEIATGLALLAAPSVVHDALIGSSTADAPVVDRVLGGALLALGIAGGLTDPHAPQRGIRAAFVVYNASTAAVLALAGFARAADGVLLWPTSALHAFIAVRIASSHGDLREAPAA
jgi:hypothetical protein